ncbi:MAG: GTP 3',8-cyclase MoaA [Oscillospiraceae bacterium]|nr:GTP 3',8-cyclase MoaA [Oscillospiraceae bacterium]
MLDSYGRTIDYLRLSVTERCQLRCAYCMPAGACGGRDDAALCSRDELTELAAACAALGVRKIRLTGGEPLLRTDLLPLIEGLRTLPGLEELALTTNGQRLAELAAPLRAAGLDRLNVSLDTLRPARYRALTGGGALRRVLDGLSAAEAAGFRDLRLNAVLLKGVNDDELVELAGLARTHPWSVRFIELMPIGPGAAMPEAFLPADAVLEAVPELRELQKAKGNFQREATEDGGTDPSTSLRSAQDDRPRGVARLYTAPGWAGTVGLIAPMSACFCAACSRIRITADGRLKPCLHSPEEYPLRGLHGDDLTAAILAAVQRKPARHHLSGSNASESARPMNEIGG